MAQKTNSFEKFWKELKRRKVVNVITVYAAVAFVILQLVDMVAEPLRLPVSTKALVIVLLCIGFIIAVFVSWVYDITPAGVKRTKPASAVKHTDHTAHPVSSRWKIATYVSGAIIIALIAFNFINRRNLNADISILDKSIAVLPFKSLSDDPDKQYLADGMMDAILLHLSKIKDLRTMSRTSVVQYRKTDKTLNVIGKELDVAYLLEGSFQKFGDNARLIVQLIKTGKEGHVWANDYDRNWNNVFSVQSEVAQAIAKELNAAITPEEKQLIEKMPTSNLTAYDFYQRGRDKLTKYWTTSDNVALNKAEDLFHKALEFDSTYAQAYTGLAFTYWYKHVGSDYLSEHFLDSLLILTNIALSFDNQLSEAYTVKGLYYSQSGKPEEAIEEYDKAIKFNPNDWMAYFEKGKLYYAHTDLVNLINSYQKAVSLNHGPELPALLRGIGWAYFCAGFPEKSKYYYQEEFKLDGDSVAYYSSSAWDEFWLGNYNKSIEWGRKGYAIDSTNADILSILGRNYVYLGPYEESLKYYKRYIEILKTSGQLAIGDVQWIGYAYWQNGYKKEAEYYFNEQIKYCNKMNELKRSWGQSLYTYYDLASVYAFRGEKDKAYKNLRIFNKIPRIPLWMVAYIKIDLLINSIRNEPEFQQIVKDVEAKYQAEHERVRKWLEEQGMLN